MGQERQALRAQVEELRRSLEEIQSKHTDEIEAMRTQHTAEISIAQQSRTDGESSTVEEELREEVTTVRAALEESESAKEQAESQYQMLLGRVNTIKASLGERLKADKQSLEEARAQIEDLETENEHLKDGKKLVEAECAKLRQQLSEASSELSGLRDRHGLSQQNWLNERGDLSQRLKQSRDEAEAAKEAMGDWEVLAMEERSIREALEARIVDMEEQLSAHKEAYEAIVSQGETASQANTGLQRALQELQDTRKRELREMVETYEEQVQGLKKMVEETTAKAQDATASWEALRNEVDRLSPFEKEVREKNLLIGKLRHEAIVLNDHLTKALRFLKKAKPEDNIDR